jgi:hypothetical protein
MRRISLVPTAAIGSPAWMMLLRTDCDEDSEYGGRVCSSRARAHAIHWIGTPIQARECSIRGRVAVARSVEATRRMWGMRGWIPRRNGRPEGVGA